MKKSSKKFKKLKMVSLNNINCNQFLILSISLFLGLNHFSIIGFELVQQQILLGTCRKIIYKF